MAVDRQLDENIYGLLQRQYVGGGVPARIPSPASTFSVQPVSSPAPTPAAQPVQPVAAGALPPGSEFANDMRFFATMAEAHFPQRFAQMGFTGPFLVETGNMLPVETEQGTSMVPETAPSPEFVNFVKQNQLDIAVQDRGFFNSTTFLTQGGQPVDKVEDRLRGLDKFLSQATDVAVPAILGLTLAAPITAALSAAVPGISTATATSVGKVLAPTALQLVQTGKVDVNTAVRSAVGSFVGQNIGSEAAKAANQAYMEATGSALPQVALQAVSNAAGSAAATALQQGADLSDVGRNAIAGSISAAVSDTLRQSGLNPSLAEGTGRAVGSYVSSGSGAQAIVSGLIRGITYEQPRQAPAPVEERVGTPVAPERETAPAEPAPAPAERPDMQTIEVTGQRDTGVAPDFISTPPPQQPGAQRIEITARRQPPAVFDFISGESSSAPQTSEPAVAPPTTAATPPPAPERSVTVSPTDLFSLVRRTRSAPQAVARLAGMGYPMSRTMGTGGFSPAGGIEPGGSYEARQPVWNEASLRLKDALGL